MKTIYNYAFRIVCVYIFALTVFALTTVDITVNKSEYKIANANVAKELESDLIVSKTNNSVENPTDEINKNKESQPEEKVEEKKESQVTEAPKEEVKNTYNYVPTIDTSAYPVLQVASGNLSHYGHDCYGCTSGRTASGYDISNGNIYYNDNVFGSVRIVAAGYEYPEGTIMRIHNVNSTPLIAIVLDRGGAIGTGKKYTLDLLTESNNQAYQLGTRHGIQIEILRIGY